MARIATPSRRSRLQRGVTLLESTVATGVIAVVAGTVMPALTTLQTHQAVAGAAAEFETDVQHARSMAVASGTTWRIGFESADGASCYVVHTGPTGQCRCLGAAAGTCDDGSRPWRVANFAAGTAVAMSANVRAMAFDPLKGTSTPAGTVKLTGRDGAAVHQVVNIMGRVRSCSPERAISGYRAC